MKPFVSLIVPCRNEEATIGRVVESLLGQDYPADRVEILFVDGMSTDRTRALIERFGRDCSMPAIRVLENPDRITPVAFNIGIAAARGDVVFTLGAHSRYSQNYVSGVVATMQEMSAHAVGSVAVTMPGGSSTVARAIAAVLASRFGVGNSLMRVGVNQPCEADTASCPGYRRTVFETGERATGDGGRETEKERFQISECGLQNAKCPEEDTKRKDGGMSYELGAAPDVRVGWFNERLVRNQDIEFNLRLHRAGGKVVLDPGIKTFYQARGRVRDLSANSFSNGYWVVRGAKVARLPCSPRHLVPLAFVAALLLTGAAGLFRLTALSGLAVVAGCYLAADLWFSARAAAGRGRGLVLSLLFVFPVLHFSYGLGSLWALLTQWIPEPRRVASGEWRVARGKLGVAAR
jgi:glycosyltransferase involved in cell wall biosynthesis